MPRVIGILVFDGVEELDFVGPLEVFGMARRFGADLTTLIIAPGAEPVRADNGLRIIPDASIADAPPLDVLLVPGGRGARGFARNDRQVLDFVRRSAAGGWAVAVCTGSLVLAAAGVLDGHRATTHFSAYDLLRETPGVEVAAGERWIIEAPIATSAGVSAGIDLALALVGEWYGQELRARAAERMEWPGRQ